VWLRRANGWATLAWLALLPVALATGLKNSLPFIVAVSIYANVVGHFSAWVAGRAEVASEVNP
jgi:hypothetical protein